MTVVLILLVAAAFSTGWARGAERRSRTVVHPETETLAVAAVAAVVSRLLVLAALVAAVVVVLIEVLP